MFGQKHVIPEESSVEVANPERKSFDYQSFCSKKSKEACLWSTRRKINLERVQSRATVQWGVGGKGGATMSGSVNGPEDWEKAEAIAGEWAGSNKKDVHVELKVEYRLCLEEGDEDQFSDPDMYEEETSQAQISGTTTTTTATIKRGRRTATMIQQEEMAKQQRQDQCYITELMSEWRCQNANCKQFQENACLVLPQDGKCRPLNGHVLGIWDMKIKKGEAAVKAFPGDVKPPPIANEKKTSTSSAATLTTIPAIPPPMQISVNTPAPQIPPWWLPMSQGPPLWAGAR